MLCFALSGYSLSANVMETLVKKGMKIEEIKKAASGLKVSDRLFCYSTLIRNTQESVWVRERLEGEYKSFNGYDLRTCGTSVDKYWQHGCAGLSCDAPRNDKI